MKLKRIRKEGYDLLMHQLLMHIFAKYENERTISAAFHILQGKRSGTTMQDVGLYKLFPYFGIFRKFPRQEFDRLVQQLQHNDYIEIEDSGHFRLLPKGRESLQEPFDLYLDGWHYRGNEHLFFGRLSLIIQALSHQAAGHKAFAPIERNEAIQQFSRRYLTYHNFHTKPIQQAFREQLLACFEDTQLTDEQLNIVTQRLHGAEVFGYTWAQIAENCERDVLSCQLLFISALHKILYQLEQQHYSMLQPLVYGVKITNVLTESAQLTANLLLQGRTLDEIAQIRRLKMSTIEDHIVEFAMYEPSFPIDVFISQQDREKVYEAIDSYMTKKLKVLKEAVPHLSYFQLKLALAKEGIH